jgi:hypothetical protein
MAATMVTMTKANQLQNTVFCLSQVRRPQNNLISFNEELHYSIDSPAYAVLYEWQANWHSSKSGVSISKQAKQCATQILHSEQVQIQAFGYLQPVSRLTEKQGGAKNQNTITHIIDIIIPSIPDTFHQMA